MVLNAAACVLCFGLAGVIWSLPGLRRRRMLRARTCTVCHRHRRAGAVLLAVMATLLLVGIAFRVQTALTPQVICHSHVSPDGRVQAEPLLSVSPPNWWHRARDVLVAPVSGIAVAAGRSVGMKPCAGPPLLVMFWPPPRESGGGSTLGNVFLAWMPTSDDNDGPLGSGGYGRASEESYVRYGPNISNSRAEEAALAVHESRHCDQDAVGAVIGGPFATAAGYFVDGAFFPGSRNHFERLAGLALGGYPQPPGLGPAPRWPEASLVVLALVLLLRRRLRWSIRVLLRHGRPFARATDRCALHTPGWA